MTTITVNNLTKKYGSFLALDNLSTSLEGEKIIGLLGPNGAGKSTFIRILMQIYDPTSGEILIDKANLNPKHRSLFGYLPEERGLYPDLSLVDQLMLFAKIHGLPTKIAKQKIKYWIEKINLEKYLSKKIQNLSKGMQQKIQFISAILHDPEVLVLDEPLSGLDPINSDFINQYILSAKKEGRTVIFSTHRMEQAQELCDQIILLNKGKKVLDGDLLTIKNQEFANKYSLIFEDYIKTKKYLQKQPKLKILSENLDSKEFLVEMPSEIIPEVVAELSKLSTIVQFAKINPTINEIFFKYVS